MLKTLAITLLLLGPITASAGGLVPCGGDGQDPCQFCHFIVLTKNISNWLVIVFGVIVALMFIYAGIRMAMAGTNASAMRMSKTIIVNSFVGYVILLGAWFITGFLLSALIGGGGSLPGYGMWDAPVACEAQPDLPAVNNNTVNPGG